VSCCHIATIVAHRTDANSNLHTLLQCLILVINLQQANSTLSRHNFSAAAYRTRNAPLEPAAHYTCTVAQPSMQPSVRLTSAVVPSSRV
jgi:hypothetical protein